MVPELQDFSGFKLNIFRKRCFEAFLNEMVPFVKINDAEHFCFKNYPYEYIYRFIYGPTHEIDEKAFSSKGGAECQNN